MQEAQLLYRATAIAGGAHPGEVRSGDALVQATLALPAELGGSGGKGTNPEQLLAAAYAACFYAALQQAASETRAALPQDFGVECSVGLGRRNDGFALDVQVQVQGGVEPGLVARAEQLWPHGPGVAPQVRITGEA